MVAKNERENSSQKGHMSKSTTSKTELTASGSGSATYTGRRPLAYLDKVVREWISDPAIRSKDTLLPGNSLESLNDLFKIEAKELPDNTIIN